MKVVSVLASVLLCGTFAFWPEKQTTAELVWNPKVGDRAGSLVLSRGWPTSLVFSTSCSDLRGNRSFEALNTGGLVFRSDGHRRITLKTTNLSESPPVGLPESVHGVNAVLPDGQCRVVGGFRSEDLNIFLRVGEKMVVRPVPEGAFPSVTQLEAGPRSGPSVKRVEIVTRPTGIDTSLSRNLLGVVALLALVMAIYLCVFRSRSVQPGRREATDSGESLFRWPDLGVAITLGVAALLIPSNVDDGWVWARLIAEGRTGVNSNLFGGQDDWVFQGVLHETVLRYLIDAGIPFVGLRLITAAVLFLAWIILRKGLIELLVSSSGKVIWPAAAGYAAFASSYLITLRAEPWVVLCICASLAALASFIQRPSRAALFLGLGFGALALAAHQTGLAAAGPVIVLAWLAVTALRQGELNVTDISLSVGLVALLSVFTLSIPFSLPTVLTSWREWTYEGGLGGSLNELERISWVFQQASMPRLFILLASVSVALSLSLWLTTVLDRHRQLPLLLASIGCFVGLLFTTSKWEWHLGVLAPAFGVFLALSLAAFFGSKIKPLYRGGPVLLFGLLVFSFLLASGSTAGFGIHDYGVLSWERLADFISPGNQLFLWLLVLVLLVIGIRLSWSLSKKTWESLVAGASSLLLVLPLMIAMAWITVDSIKHDQWTLARQNIEELRGDAGCGALNGVELVAGGPQPLKVVEDWPLALSKRGSSLQSGAVKTSEEQINRPFPNLPAWGTFGTDGDEGSVGAEPGRPVRNISPLFRIRGSSKVKAWTLGAKNYEGVTIEKSFIAENGELISKSVLEMPVSSTWQGYDPSTWLLRDLNVPTGADFVFFTISIDSPLEGQWAAVSTPANVRTGSPEEVLNQGRAFVWPPELLHTPCLDVVTPEFGHWPQFSFLLRDYGSIGLLPANQDDLSKTSIGCSTYGRTCVERLWYPEAGVQETLRPYNAYSSGT